MIRIITTALAAATVAIGLSACDKIPLGVSTVAAVAPVVLPPEHLAELQSICQTAGLPLAIASAPTMPAVLRETAIYGASFCDQLRAGMVPPTADGNSVSWLSRIVAVLPAVARTVGVAL